MRLTLLAVAATLLPFIWGWFVHWLIGRLWPEQPRPRDPAPQQDTAKSVPLDFQI